MESVVCFPEPLGCFLLPSRGRLFPADDYREDDEAGEDYLDECILSDETLVASLRAQDAPDCFLCLAERLGEEE